MTDIRARLAEALELAIRNDLHAPSPVPAGVIAGHVVDVLLSLSGVAVVELTGIAHRGAWRVLIGGEHESVYPLPGTDTIRVSGTMDLFIDEVRPLAAALLAVANTAERAAK